MSFIILPFLYPSWCQLIILLPKYVTKIYPLLTVLSVAICAKPTSLASITHNNLPAGIFTSCCTWQLKRPTLIMASLLKALQWLHITLEINFRLFNMHYKALWIPLFLIYIALSLGLCPDTLKPKATFLLQYCGVSNICACISLTSAFFESFHMLCFCLDHFAWLTPSSPLVPA